MAGLFESVTKVAIEEILLARAKPSKFGYILSPESFKELTQDLYHLLATSRSLKAAGDKLLAPPPSKAPTLGGPRPAVKAR